MEQSGSSTDMPIEPFQGRGANLITVQPAGATPRSGGETAVETPLLSAPMARALKRAMDIVGSASALIVLSPLLIVLMIALTVETGGHPIFLQQRIGRSGSLFKIFKFRTMSRDSEDRLVSSLERDEELAHEWATLRKLRYDPRVTRAGRLLRKYSLDELPQFANVLLGQMSLVGPRPIVEEESLLFGHHLPAVLSMRPGLTGLWGVSGRNELGYEERVLLEERYVHGWTLGLDLSILLRTIPRVIKGSGAF